jgi:hypothetical protein
VGRDEARATCGVLSTRLINQAAVRCLVRTGEKDFSHIDGLNGCVSTLVLVF